MKDSYNEKRPMFCILFLIIHSISPVIPIYLYVPLLLLRLYEAPASEPENEKPGVCVCVLAGRAETGRGEQARRLMCSIDTAIDRENCVAEREMQ